MNLRRLFQNIVLKGFALCLAVAAMSVDAADVTLYTVTKGQLNVQTNGNAPAPAVLPYSYLARVWLAPGNQVTLFGSGGSASVKLTNIFVFLPITQLMGRSAQLLEVRTSYPSQSLLDSSYPTNVYVFHIPFLNGTSTNLLLALPAGTPPATAPHVNNFAAAQTIDPGADFALGWDAFSGGTTGDFIWLQIEDGSTNVFDSGDSIFGGGLDGTATGITIPANTLKPAHGYVGHLIFEKVAATNGGYAPAFSGYSQQTDFYLATSGATIPALVSTVPAPGATNVPANVKLTFTFSEPMKPNSYSILAGGTTNGTTQALSADGKTFTITPNSPWPTSSVSVYFNPIGGFNGDRVLFGDTNNSPLMPDTFAARFTAGTNLLDATPSPPYLEILGPPANGAFQLRLTGEAYRSYQLLVSSNLLSWDALTTILATNPHVIFTDPASSPPATRLYRVLATPVSGGFAVTQNTKA